MVAHVVGGWGTFHCRLPRRGWRCPLLPGHPGYCPTTPAMWNLLGWFWGRTR